MIMMVRINAVNKSAINIIFSFLYIIFSALSGICAAYFQHAPDRAEMNVLQISEVIIGCRIS
jgi:hypothetical protein